MRKRVKNEGVVLVNVLVILVIAGGLMALLLSTQEASLARVSRSADASTVEQIAFGAEASVVDALRRDLDDAPETDHFQEPWALGVIQDEVTLPTGKFSVQVSDLQAKFDINQLADSNVGTQAFTRRLLLALDQPAETANQISRILEVVGRVRQLDDLAAFGVSTETLAALAPYVVALPVDGTINLNSVDPFLLAVMLQNQSQAKQLVLIREGRGSLRLEDLKTVGALRPQNSGLISNTFRIDIEAQAGTSEINMQSFIFRQNARGIKVVSILERHFVYDTPDDNQ
jgi:general secretion pathway protein K